MSLRIAINIPIEDGTLDLVDVLRRASDFTFKHPLSSMIIRGSELQARYDG